MRGIGSNPQFIRSCHLFWHHVGSPAARERRRHMRRDGGQNLQLSKRSRLRRFENSQKLRQVLAPPTGFSNVHCSLADACRRLDPTLALLQFVFVPRSPSDAPAKLPHLRSWQLRRLHFIRFTSPASCILSPAALRTRRAIRISPTPSAAPPVLHLLASIAPWHACCRPSLGWSSLLLSPFHCELSRRLSRRSAPMFGHICRLRSATSRQTTGNQSHPQSHNNSHSHVPDLLFSTYMILAAPFLQSSAT